MLLLLLLAMKYFRKFWEILTSLLKNELSHSTLTNTTPALILISSLFLSLRILKQVHLENLDLKLSEDYVLKISFKIFLLEEYFKTNHAEPVPIADLQKPLKDVFYLPMHAVRKEHSTTTKIRVVCDASAKSSTGLSLNDILLVGPTVHSSLIDVLFRFRCHRTALTTDVSKMC